MSDALQDAEALYELLGKSENYVTVKDVLKGAIDEIKRLQEENESQKTDYILMNKRYEAYIGGPGDDVKLLKGQLAKWQQTAIEERAKATYYLDDWSHFGGDFQLIRWENAKTNIRDHYMGQAAKELGLQMSQEASYLGRLETAFLEMYPLFKGTTDEQAQAALAKIREGKPL